MTVLVAGTIAPDTAADAHVAVLRGLWFAANDSVVFAPLADDEAFSQPALIETVALWPWEVHAAFAGQILEGQQTAGILDPLYIGAAGQAVVYLGATPAASLYLGAARTSLF